MTTSDNEWQPVTTSGTTSDKEWQRVTQWVTTNGNEWQRVTAVAATPVKKVTLDDRMDGSSCSSLRS